MLRIVTDRWTDVFTDRQWWLLAWRAACNFWRQFLPCSLALVLANFIVIFVTANLERSLRGLQQNPTNDDLMHLMATGIFSAGAILSALFICFWGLYEWMIRLTAFAGLLAGGHASASREDISEAVRRMAARKIYLLKVWLMASVYLLAPAIPLSFFIGMKTVFGDRSHLLFDPTIVPPPAWLQDDRISVAIGIAMFVLMLVSMLYTYVTIVFSSLSDLPAVRTANIAFRESLKHAVPLLVITAIILLANVALTAPQMLMRLTPCAALVQTPVAEACAQVWLGFTSLFVWPLSLAPYCRLIQRVDQTD